MKGYQLESIMAHMLIKQDQQSYLSNFAEGIAGFPIRVFAKKVDAAYSQYDYRSTPEIVLGTLFPYQVYDFKEVPFKDLKEFANKEMSTLITALFAHELSHILYTPFVYSKDKIDEYAYVIRDFLHTVMNILEDISIEGTSMNRYPWCVEPLKYLRSKLFYKEETVTRLADAINTEPDNPATMLAFLLHLVRNGDLSKLPTYNHYEDNKDFFKYGIHKCVNTILPHKRIDRMVAFAINLLKILDYKVPDKDEVEKGETSTGSSCSDFSNGAQNIGSGKASKNLGEFARHHSSWGAHDSEKQETDSNVIEEDLSHPQKASRDTSSNGPTLTLNKCGMSALANDDPVFNYPHAFSKLSKYCDTSSHLPSYNSIVKKYSKQINNIVNIIRRMKATNNISIQRNLSRGKLDTKALYKQNLLKSFKKAIAPSEEADLVFELLVDNSGSMSGSKTKLAGINLIIFCEALNRLHIPFAVDAFTEGSSTAITIGCKDFTESYNRTKTNMTLFTDQIDVPQLYTFAGNIDEVNVQYVCNRLLTQPQKDKYLIVISDGATCGADYELRKLVKSYEAQGIITLGIGIYDRNVESIYDNHVVIKTTEDLEKLYAFLNKYLVKRIFKKGGKS